MARSRIIIAVLALVACTSLFGCATRMQNAAAGAVGGAAGGAALTHNPAGAAVGAFLGFIGGAGIPGADELVPRYGGVQYGAPAYQPRTEQDCANMAGGNTPVYQSCLRGLADARDREQHAAEQRAYEFGSGTPGGAQYAPRSYYAPAPPVYVPPPSFYYAPTPRYGHPYGPWRGW